MGYEMGLLRKADAASDGDFDPLWFACGWDKYELFRELSKLAAKEVADDDGEVVLDVSKLHFLVELDDNLSRQSIFQVTNALAELGWDYAQDFVESLPKEIRAAMVLPFGGGEPEEAEVRRLLCESAFDSGSTWLTSGLADAVRTLEGEGADEAIMYGG